MAVTALAPLAFCQKAKVLKLENGAGSCTVQTDLKDCRITVVQIDAGKNPVRSRTAQTDSNGRAVLPSQEKLGAKQVEVRRLNLPDLVAPSNIVEGEVVMVAMPRAADGEVISIKTVEGEVVATKKADRLGRVLLPISLAAGAYLLSREGGGKNCPLNVQSQTGPLNSSGWADADQPLRLPNTGSGAATAVLHNIEIPVLAKSPRQLVVATPADYGADAGTQSVTLKDADGQPVAAQTISMYHLQGVLNRQKLMTGEAARLEFRLEPSTLKGSLTVGVLSGPVRLPNGGQTQALTLSNGGASIAVQSIPGQTGPFQLSWAFTPDPGQNHATEALPPEPFIDPVTGDTVLVQEVRKGYIRHLIKHRDGTATVVERVDNGEFVEGQPLETITEIHTDGTTVTTTEILKRKDTGEVISGNRKKVKKTGDKEETQSEEKWDRDKKGWVAGK